MGGANKFLNFEKFSLFMKMSYRHAMLVCEVNVTFCLMKGFFARPRPLYSWLAISDLPLPCGPARCTLSPLFTKLFKIRPYFAVVLVCTKISS